MTDPESPECIGDTSQSPQEPMPRHSFSLASLVLFMTLTAVLLGVAKWNLGAGIALVILCFPAWIRTRRIADRSNSKGVVLSFGEKVLAFVLSLALVAVIAGVTGGSFLAIAYLLAIVSEFGVAAIVLVVVSAIAVSGSLGGLLIHICWTPKE